MMNKNGYPVTRQWADMAGAEADGGRRFFRLDRAAHLRLVMDFHLDGTLRRLRIWSPVADAFLKIPATCGEFIQLLENLNLALILRHDDNPQAAGEP